jgi:hypothetical protein
MTFFVSGFFHQTTTPGPNTVDTMRSNSGVYKIFVELFHLKVTPRCLHHQGVDLKGLREVNFTIKGLLPMGEEITIVKFF